MSLDTAGLLVMALGLALPMIWIVIDSHCCWRAYLREREEHRLATEQARLEGRRPPPAEPMECI